MQETANLLINALKHEKDGKQIKSQ